MAIKKILNPFVGLDGYSCYGCYPESKVGLKMSFFYDEEKDVLFSHWTPQLEYQGYNNILHGGVQSALMDEIASWYVFSRLGTSAVTKKLEVDFVSGVPVDKGDIYLEAKLLEIQKRTAVISTLLRLKKDETVLSSGTYHFGMFPAKMAQEKLGYPGQEAFYE